MTRTAKGTLLAASAYLMWGLFPLYWPLLEPARAVEILAHRFVWSLLVVLALLAVRRSWSWIGVLRRDPRRVAMLVLASALIAVNWGVYIWGVNHGHVVETSLGYFINPLVTILLGVGLLGERLRPLQWAAVAVAAGAVVVLTVDYGRLPWIGLVLAFSFGGYGLIKKQAGVDALPSLATETAAAFVPALAYLVVLEANGSGTFGHVSVAQSLLLAGTGIVTAIPLLCFGGAVIRVPLSTMGLLQYLTPTMQFAIGVLVRHEPMPASRLAGFALVWVALAMLTTDLLHARLRPRDVAPV